MTRLSGMRGFALAGVCAATVGAGGTLVPPPAFALPPSDPGTCPLMEEHPGCFNYSGGTGMIPPQTGPYDEPDLEPQFVCHLDEELGRRVCEKDGPPPKP